MRPVKSGDMLMLMLHSDNGPKKGEFEYTLGAKEDGPVRVNDKLVMVDDHRQIRRVPVPGPWAGGRRPVSCFCGQETGRVSLDRFRFRLKRCYLRSAADATPASKRHDRQHRRHAGIDRGTNPIRSPSVTHRRRRDQNARIAHRGDDAHARA
jgi:hypothetical protein